MRSAVAGADVVVVDSLASNTLGPWLAVGLARRAPIVGSVHQDLGGIDVGRAAAGGRRPASTARPGGGRRT